MAKRIQGITVRHSRSCGSRRDQACTCKPSYEAWVWSPRDAKKIRRSFPTLAAARLWRSDTHVGVQRGTIKAPVPTTLREAADVWLEGVKNGTVRNRSGHPYKPSAIRGYE